MKETTPAVHLIAEPRLNWDAVKAYLESVGGLAWYDRVSSSTGAGPTDAELLIEFAGRGCYRSWEPGLNPNVTRVREDSGAYLQNILDVKHGSVLEHAQFTFVFQDVSRVFTHELVRHRAGVAISQESLRFVRLQDLSVWLPPAFTDPDRTMVSPLDGEVHALEDVVISMVEKLEEFQKNAADAFGLDDEGVPFHVKKQVTSHLRRIAPIGLATMMTWSANVRTLRFVIEQRTAAGAEEEIRLVFDQVARMMRNTQPLLFGDFEPYPVADSEIPEWKSSSWKV